MTRRIRSHKGGRTARAPEARMTPQERGRLDAVIQHRGVKYIDWYIGHVNADYKQITGGKGMNTRQASKLAEKAMSEVTVTVEERIGGEIHQDGPVAVADTTVLFLNEDGTYSVCDNGEEVDGLDRDEAIRVIIENLTAS